MGRGSLRRGCDEPESDLKQYFSRCRKCLLGMAQAQMRGNPMEAIKQYSGAILTCLGALVLVGVLCAIFWLLTKLSPQDDSGSLPLLAIGGIVVLIFMLAA